MDEIDIISHLIDVEHEASSLVLDAQLKQTSVLLMPAPWQIPSLKNSMRR